MISPIITAKIYSQLGSNTSLLPIAVKDLSHSAGLTTSSYITGSGIEGKDRFIDEFGTQAIWLGGIPFYKKLIDKTVYKLAKQNANLDIRVLKNEKIAQKAIQYAPTEEIAKSIKKATDNMKTFKGLFLAKFVASTVLCLGSYAGLTIFRHNQTEKAIIKEIQEEIKTENKTKANTEFIKNKNVKRGQSFSSLFSEQKKQKNPSFGMRFSEGMKDFMFNPVKNMMIVDGGITAERLKDSRNPQDFLGYAIKEGSFWAFMYLLGPKIQEHFENKAQTKNNKNITLDLKVLQNEEFINSLSKKAANSNLTKMEESLSEFAKNKSDEEVYDFICNNKNKDNLVVKMAKKSGIIEEFKNTGKIDTQKFIDLEKVKGVSLKIQNLIEQKNSSTETLEDFMKKAVSLKKGSIMKNLGACVGVLGLVVPGIMLAIRYADKENKEFQVKTQIKEKLLQKTA